MKAACVALFLSLGVALSAGGAERVAFVIGNAAYDQAGALANPVQDARAVAARLTEAGYDVTRVEDGGIQKLYAGLRQFCEKAKGAEVALFFFAGHGIEAKGENYLLPVDAVLAEEADLDLQALALDRVLNDIAKTKSVLKVIVLDCCRNNPLAASRGWMKRSRSLGGGLAEVGYDKLAEGTLVVFSGAPGKEVPDGVGQAHSPFAAALLKQMSTPGTSLAGVFSGVAQAVAEQEPWIRFDGSGRSFADFSSYPLVPGQAPATPNAEALAERKRITELEALVAKLTAESTGRADQTAEIAALKAQMAAMANAQTEGGGVKPPRESPAASVGSTQMKPSDDFDQFATLDKDKDGALSFEEVEVGHSRERARQWDANADGRISLDEWQAAPAASKRPGKSPKTVGSTQMNSSSARSQFATLDKDGDGTLNFEEAGVDQSEARSQEWDVDRDGRISLSEWLAVHVPLPSQSATAGVVMTPPAFPANTAKPTVPLPPTPLPSNDSLPTGVSLTRGVIGDSRSFDLGGGEKMVLKYVPGGEFLMGSPEDEESRGEDENQGKVTLSRHFWMGETELTQGQWAAFMKTTPAQQQGKGDSKGEIKGTGPSHPMYFVSWEDAQAFLGELGRLVPLAEGWQWSLPTEAQWERACRAGTETVFAFGNSLDSSQANFNGERPYGKGRKGPYLETTAPVKSYRPNAFGLYDMHGNVSEWCLDGWDWSVKDKQTGGVDPLETQGPLKVIRGGPWGGYAAICRSAERGGMEPASRTSAAGFRVSIVSVNPTN